MEDLGVTNLNFCNLIALSKKFTNEQKSPILLPYPPWAKTFVHIYMSKTSNLQPKFWLFAISGTYEHGIQNISYIYKRQTPKTRFDAVNMKTVGFYPACDVYIKSLYGPTTYRHIGPKVFGLGDRQDQFFGVQNDNFEPCFWPFFQTRIKTRQIILKS